MPRISHAPSSRSKVARMPAAENSIVVNRPRSEVFAFVADHENDPKWRPGVNDIKHASGEGVGTVYRQGMKGPFVRRIPADFEVAAYEQNSHMAFRTLGGPDQPEGVFRFEETDGGTRVTFSLTADLRGAQTLIAPMVARSMRYEVRPLENLKQVLET